MNTSKLHWILFLDALRCATKLSCLGGAGKDLIEVWLRSDAWLPHKSIKIIQGCEVITALFRIIQRRHENNLNNANWML